MALDREWSPEAVPHVVGRYESRKWDSETRMPEPQRFEIACSICNAVYKGECLSGEVRRHIANFATAHLHRDPLNAPRVRRPGSLFKPRE